MVEIGLLYTTMLSPEKAKALSLIAEQAANLKGEFWDCGCNSGGSAILLKMAAPRKLLRLFDSFQGLPKGSDEDTTNEPGLFKIDYDERLWILGPVYVGKIPETFRGLENSRVALAHVDLDLYQATKDALEFLMPRIIPGGVIVVDDYNAYGWGGVKIAVDEMVNENFIRTISAPEQVTLTRKS